MTTKDFIQQWNAGNRRDREAMAVEFELTDFHEAMRVNCENGGAIFLVAIPRIRVGILWTQSRTERKFGKAFRLYPNGLQTFNSFSKLNEPQPGWADKVKNEFVLAFNGVVDPEHADN